MQFFKKVASCLFIHLTFLLHHTIYYVRRNIILLLLIMEMRKEKELRMTLNLAWK